MAFPSKTKVRLQQERRDTFLATGTVTRYFHSSQIRYIDVFVVGAGGSGGTQNNGGTITVVHGGSGGGVGAFRMDLLKVCDLFNSGRHMVFTVTTAIGTGGTAVTCSASAGVLIVGNAGGISSVTVKGTTRSGTSVGAIFKATGGNGGQNAVGSYSGGGFGGTSVDTSTTYIAFPNFLNSDSMIQALPILGGSLPTTNIFQACGTNSALRSAGIYAEGYITSVGGGGASNQAGGTHNLLQLPQWVIDGGVSTGTAGSGASSAGGGGASFNGAGGNAGSATSGTAATGYGGGGGACRGTSSHSSGAGAPGVAVISAVRH